MKVELKTWATLGLATALAGAGLAGCSGEAGEGEGGEAAQTSEAGELGEGEGGEGEGGEGEGGEGEGGESGESGETGVSVSDAASDPVIYGSALAIAEAHAIAARDAFALGEKEPAAEMFAHPVSEVLADMDPTFEALGVEDFKPLFGEASASALGDGGADDVTARYDAIIAALRAAAEKAPDNGASDAAIAAGVSADMIDRAIRQYREAVSSGEYEPYLDGYGFYKAGAAGFEASSEAIKAENAALHTALGEALGLLAAAYPDAGRQDELSANQGELVAAGSKILLAMPAS